MERRIARLALFVIGLRLLSKQIHRRDMVPSESGAEAEHRILADVLLPLAVVRLDGTLRDSDAADTKILGTLAIAAASLGVLITSHGSLNHYWWGSAAGIGTAGVLLLVAIWPREFSLGPDLDRFHGSFGDGSAREASRQMLSELIAATDFNLRRGKMQTFAKVAVFRLALILLVGSLVSCVPIVLLRPEGQQVKPKTTTIQRSHG